LSPSHCALCDDNDVLELEHPGGVKERQRFSRAWFKIVWQDCINKIVIAFVFSFELH
jgi:hypothetical protein